MNYGGGGGGRGLGLGGGSHRSWFAYVRSGDEHPQMTGQLLRRVFSYARPYLEGDHRNVGGDSDQHRLDFADAVDLPQHD